MNIYQKAFSGATKANIKLFPLDKDDSFYKRRKIFRQAWKLKIDLNDLTENTDDEELAHMKSVLDEPFEIDCLGCDYKKIDSYSLMLRHCNKCNNYKKNVHWECKYCDGVNPTYWHGDKEEPMICGNCGAEWEDAKILVEDEEYDEDYGEYGDYDEDHEYQEED